MQGSAPLVLIAAAFIAVLLWLSVLYHLHQKREGDMAAARRDATNMSIALAEQVSRLVEGADQVLRLMQEDYGRDPERFDLTVWVNRSASLRSVANQIAIFDDRGDLLASMRADAVGSRVNIADRPMFVYLKKHPDAGLFIGRTYASRIQRAMVLPLGRRLVDSGGAFRGLIAVSLDPGRLAKEFKALDVGPGGSIALLGMDGFIRARVPTVEGMYDRDVLNHGPTPGVFKALKEASVGVYEAVSAFDAKERIFGYREVEGLPLVISVGLAMDDVLAPFRRELLRITTFGLLSTIILSLLLMTLLQEQKRREAREQALARSNVALAEAESSFRGVFESSPDILIVLRVTAQGEITVELMNAATITARYAGEDYRGKRLEDLLPPQAFARASRSVAHVVETRESLRLQQHCFDDDRECEVIIVPLSFDDSQGVTRVFVSIRDISHLRRAQTANAASEARYRLLADNTTDMITHMDLTGRRLFVSPASRDLLGYACEELVGTSPQEMIHPDDAPSLRVIFDDFAAGHVDRFVNVNRLRHKDGRWIWIEASLKLLRDSRGQPASVVGVMRDITERLRVEAKLKTSEARFRLLAESTSDVFTRLNLRDFSREYISPGCRQVLGFEPEEMLGKVPSDSMHPEDAPEVHDLAKRLVSGETIEEKVTVTYRTRHKLGHWVWIEGGMSLARDDTGTPLAIICSLRDVTERRRAEAAVEASEARFRLLAENASELVVLGKEDGTRTYISSASKRLFGYTPEEISEEMASKRWVHPHDRELLAKASLGSDETTSVVCRVKHKNGAWIWVEAIIRRFSTASVDEPSVVASFRDISERQAQAEALRNAKEAAEQASQAKTDFLAAMSHEIRTPLNAVLGYADLLLADVGISGPRRLSLERIQNAGSALRTVVDDILDFSKIESGEVNVKPQPFHPGALIDNAVSIVRESARAKDLDLVVDLGPDVPTLVIGDHDRLRQILLNLLNNAIKFTRAGRVMLSVRAIERAGEVVTLRFAIDDTGIGIKQDKLGRLFQRFSQVDGSISREYGGTGLGLAICKRLVEAMDGEVGVSSDVGRGSTFWFDVPLPVTAAADKLVTSEGRKVAIPFNLTLLIVEDQELNRDLAWAVLEAAGHTVDTVDNGEAAVAAVLAKQYDLVLMDVHMPLMDGLEATRKIRRLNHPNHGVSIIALTANVLPEQVASFKAAGMDGHVGKPFRREELLSAVTAFAKSSRQPRNESYAENRPALDLGVLSDLASLIGLEMTERILSETLNQIATIDIHSDHKALAARAHGLLSSAGTVGLIDLSLCLRELESACLSGVLPNATLFALAASLARANEALESARTSSGFGCAAAA